MSHEIPSRLMNVGVPAGSGEIRASDGTPDRNPAPKLPQSAIERIAGVSSDQVMLGRFVSLLIFKAQYFIIRRVYSARPPKHSRLLNLGCGDTHFDGWVNADRLRVTYLMLQAKKVMQGKLKLPEWVLDATSRWNCPDNHWEGIFTEDVLEHLSYNDAVVALKEAFRTLQPGKWMRIALPDVRRYIEFYNSKATNDSTNKWFDERFAYGAEAIAYLTQNQGHASVWDAHLLSAVLREIGFSNVTTASFADGSDQRLLMDRPSGCHESLYVEAQKPAAQ